MLARSGLMTPPCGVPVWLRFPPLIRRFPFSSRSSTATISSLCGIASKYFDRSASTRRCTPVGEHRVPLGPHPERCASVDSRTRSTRSPPRRSAPAKACGGLHHSVPNRRDSQRPLPSALLRNHHPAHRVGSVRLVPDLLSQGRKPLPEPRRLDVLEALPVHAGRPAVLLGEPVSVREHVLSVHLVVELVEAERRLLLRLRVELPLEVPDLFRSLQAHANPLTLLSFRSAPEVRPLPSTGVDRLRR